MTYLRGVIGADPRDAKHDGDHRGVPPDGSDQPEDALVVMEGDRYQREMWLVVACGAIGGADRAFMESVGLSNVTTQVPATVSALVRCGKCRDIAGRNGRTRSRPDDVSLTDLWRGGMPLTGDTMLRALGINSEFGLVPWAGTNPFLLHLFCS